MSRMCTVPSPKLPSRWTPCARNGPAASSGTVMRPSTRGAATGPSSVASNRAMPVSGQVIPARLAIGTRLASPRTVPTTASPVGARSYLAGQLGLVALPPEPHAPDGHIPCVDRALGTDPLDALAHRGRLEAEALGGRGKGERVRLRPAIGVEPTDLDRPPSIRILVQDAALPDPHHGEPRRHRADGDGVGRDRDRQAAAPRCGGGHLGPRKGHGDHELPAPEALGPGADVAVLEPEEGALFPGLATRDGDPGDSEGNRPGTEGHGLDANRAPQGRDQRALELGADQFWPAQPEEYPRRRDARSEEQHERRKPDETPPDETTPRRAQPGSATWVHVSDAPGSINASLEESRGTPPARCAAT